MSLTDYASALPSLFPAPVAKDNAEVPAAKDNTEAPAQPKETIPTRSKGFADIIEYHKTGHGGPEVDIIPTSKFLPNKKKSTRNTQTYQDYTLVLRRTWTQQGQVSFLVRIELEIQSESLCKAFREIAINSYEDTDLQSFPIKLKSPFSELFFYRNEIKALMDSESNDIDLRAEAKVLYDFMQKNGLISSIVKDHDRYSKKDQVMGDILWTIFPPNSLVVTKVGMIRECWICRNVSIQRQGPECRWILTGLRVGFDGDSPGLARQKFYLPITDMQLHKISDLPIMPIKYCQDWGTLKKVLMKRSVKLRKVLGEKLSSFSSQTYSGASWEWGFSIYHTELNPLLEARQVR